MKRFVRNVLQLLVVLSGGVMCLGPLYADGFSTAAKRLLRKGDSAADEQLKLVESLLRVRMAPLELSEGTPLNKVLDHMEKQWAESGRELKFERAPSKDDFSEPLADQKIKHDCKISGGTTAEMLEAVCLEAACAYCVKDGAVHVFPFDSETAEEVVICPGEMRYTYFDESSSKENKLRVKSHHAKKYPTGRVKLVSEGKNQIRLSGSKQGCSRAKTSIAHMYAEWVRKNDWPFYKNEVAKQPRFVADAQMNEIFVVPVVFDSSSNLGHVVKYLALHTKLGGKAKGLRIGTELQNPSSVSISGELDFSGSTLYDALVKLCDACGGYYRVKGRKVTIVPRQLETRYYWVSDQVVKLLKRNASNAAKVDKKGSFERKKNQHKAEPVKADRWKELITEQLAEYGVELPELGGIEYEPKTTKLQVETSQEAFAKLDRLYNILIPVPQK